jgi:hypothetical protein
MLLLDACFPGCQHQDLCHLLLLLLLDLLHHLLPLPLPLLLLHQPLVPDSSRGPAGVSCAGG